MNRLSIISFLLLLLIGFNANAQYELGIKGGANFCRYSDQELKGDFKSRTGSDIGAYITFPVTEIFSWQVGLEYASMGARFTHFEQLTNSDGEVPSLSQDQILYGTVTYKTVMNYLLLPVQAKFNIYISRHLSAYIDAGPYIGHMLSAYQKISTEDTYYLDNKSQQRISGQQVHQKVDVTDAFTSKIVLGFEGEAGIKYTLHRYSFFAEGGCNFLFVHIGENGDNQAHPEAITARIGVSYNFHKAVKQAGQKKLL